MKELRKQGKTLKPILSIGKNGVSEGSITLIDRELEQKQLIKIKVLPAASEGNSKEDCIKEIVRATQATVVESIGHVVVLYRKK